MSFGMNAVSLVAPEFIERQSLEKVWQIDSLWRGNSAKAGKAYDSIINTLKPLAQKGKLKSKGKEALGRAYLGKSLILLSDKDLKKGLKCFKDAARFISLNEYSFSPLLTKLYFKNKDLTEQAVYRYLNYLHMPAAQTDTHTTKIILELLKEYCQIHENDPVNTIKKKINLNLKLTALPGSEPHLVIDRGHGNIKQHILKDEIRIGSAGDNDVILQESGISEHHATLKIRGEQFVIQDFDSKNGIQVNGRPKYKPFPVHDGENFSLDNVKFILYSEPRRFDVQLEWPLFFIGIGFFIQGDYESALQFFRKAKQLNPDHANIYWYMGRISHEQEYFDDSIKYFTKALKHDGSHAGAHFSWARALESTIDDTTPKGSEAWESKMSEILPHYEKAVEFAPDNGMYAFEMARIYMLTGKSESDVAAAVKTALDLNPENAKYRMILAKQALSEGNLKLAMKIAQVSIRRNPDDREANYLLGSLFFEKKDFIKAAKLLQYVNVLEGQDKKQVFSDTPEFAYRLGRSFYEIGQYIRAITSLSPIATQSRDAMFYLGRSYSRKGHFRKAAKILLSLINQHGEEFEARFYLAATLGNMDEFAKGAAALKPLLPNKEWKSRAVCLYSRLLTCMGRKEEALNYLKQIEDDTTHRILVQFEKGRLLCVTGNYESAVTELESAIKMAPEDLFSHFWLGRALFALTDYDNAATHFNYVLKGVRKEKQDDKIRDISADVYYHLGRIARSGGNTDQALNHFEKAREYGNTSDQLMFDLATVYAIKGKYSDALEEFSSLAMKNEQDRGVDFNLAAVSCNLAGLRMKEGRIDEAISLLEQAMERFLSLDALEEASETRICLAEAYFRMGTGKILTDNKDLFAADAALVKAHNLNPEDIRYSYYLAGTCFLRKEYEKSVAMFQDIVKGGQGSGVVLKALALALEYSGDFENAEKTWKSIIDQKEIESSHATSESSQGKLALPELPMANIEARLGLAGLYARREDWLAAAKILHDILKDDSADGFEACAEVAKLAASYFSLADDYAGAEELIQQYIKGDSPGIAHAYLGAVMARQNRLQEALKHLQNAINSKNTSDAVFDLYESICCVQAAQQVIQGDFTTAESVMKDIKKKRGKLSIEAQEFLSSIRTAILLGSFEAKSEEDFLVEYKKAYEKNPENSHLKRNLAILHLKAAIHAEEESELIKADKYWEKSDNFWEEIVSDQAFWDAFAERYNRNLKRRDKLKKEHTEDVKKRLLKVINDIHEGFAIAYIRARGPLARVRKHSEYFAAIQKDRTSLKEFGEILTKEVEKCRDLSMKDMLNFFEFFLKTLMPDDEQLKNVIPNLHYSILLDALWDDNTSEFKHHLKNFSVLFTGDDNFKNLAQKTRSASDQFILKVIRCARKIFVNDRRPVSEQKQTLFKIVCNMCSLPDDQQKVLTHGSDEIIKTIIVQILT